MSDDWNGIEVHHYSDASGAECFVAIHSIRADRAIGGTRMKYYARRSDAVADVQRLAEGMSLKWAAAGIEAGGAKAVIALPEDFDAAQRAALLRRYGQRIAELGGVFRTGPDLGTSSEDMDVIAETAPGLIFGRTAAAGGAGDPAPYTARGVFTAMQVAARRHYGEAGLRDRRVLLQGMGHVATQLVPQLHAAGAELAFSEVNARVVERWVGEGLTAVAAEAVYDTPCDVFAPCAVGGTINADTIPRLRCDLVVGGANNQLGDAADAERLRRRGILYAPDYVANCGGAIALIALETEGAKPAQAMDAVVAAVERNLGQIFEVAEAEACSTETAARRLATASI